MREIGDYGLQYDYYAHCAGQKNISPAFCKKERAIPRYLKLCNRIESFVSASDKDFAVFLFVVHDYFVVYFAFG